MSWRRRRTEGQEPAAANPKLTEAFQGPSSGNRCDRTARNEAGQWVAGDVEARFWSKVEKGPGCWLWAAGLDKRGYGRFKTLVNGRWQPRQAHIVAWELTHGPVTAGDNGSDTLDHLCHNRDDDCPGGPTCRHRRCVRPDHLEPAERGENTRRAARRRARLAGRAS